MNPWLIVAAMIAIGGAFGYGVKVGGDHEQAERAEIDAMVVRVQEAGQRAAAAEIAKIDIKHTTIQAKTKEIVREEVRYTECVNVPAVERLLDDARANREPSEPAGSSVVP